MRISLVGISAALLGLLSVIVMICNLKGIANIFPNKLNEKAI